ncbi:hypothetical protein [Microcystis sp. BLCC-F210]|jgi:hypothetical protein|uniref:hypothetical protein n=1 Tax=Microcystis sp. BLCC-F210 TaxID=3342751 RepID=UPI0035C923C5
MSNGKEILVIGASHIDIIAQYGSGEEQSDSYSYSELDKEGEVNFSLGGTGLIIAYRIATLPDKEYKIRFLTTVNPNTLRGKSMLKVLKKFDIDDTYCIKDNAIKEGCFVGMYNKDEKKIESAVTQTSLETNKINDNLSKRITDKIKEAISKETSIVIADCNLHSKHLCDISNKCLETKTLLFVEGVSEYKCKRLIRITKQPNYKQPDNSHNFIISIFSCNMDEFISLVNYAKEVGIILNGECEDLVSVFNGRNSANQDCIASVCKKFLVECFLIHDNNRGYLILTKDGSSSYFQLKKPKGKGVGDAIIAGAAHYYFHETKDMNSRTNFEPDFDKMNNFIYAATEDISLKIDADLLIKEDITKMVYDDYKEVTALSTNFIKIGFFMYMILVNIACFYFVTVKALPATMLFYTFIFSGIMIAFLSRLIPPDVLIEFIKKITKI